MRIPGGTFRYICEWLKLIGFHGAKFIGFGLQWVHARHKIIFARL